MHPDKSSYIMFWIVMFVFSWSHEFVDGTPYVGVVGQDAYLNWTISNLAYDDIRFIRNPADSASVMIFDINQLTPTIILDTRATFTGDLLHSIVSFTLSNVRLSDAGNYTFTVGARNLKQILGWQVLVVAETPDTPWITSLSLSAVAGREYKLNCSTVSRSVPLDQNLTMYSDWKKNEVNITVVTGYIVSGTILTISNLDRRDTGSKITCRTFEDQRRISAESRDFILNVLYGPDDGSVTLSPNKTAYEQAENTSLSVNCSASCYRNCQYRWTGPGGGNFGNTNLLSIPRMRRDHTGVFTCTITNPGIASKSATATITVIVFCHPDVPKDVHLVPSSITTRSVGIEWMPGFHGGSDQTFVIEYKTQKDENWTNYSHNVFGGMRQKQYFNITIEGLQQNTLYFFRLYAWNMLNRSEYSTIINVTTFTESRKYTLNANGTSSVIIGSILGTCIPIAFIVIVVVVLLYRRRRLCSDGKSSSQSKSYQSATAEVTNMEYHNMANTVASTDGEHYIHLQDTTKGMNETLNTRSSDTVTYDALHPYANNEEHAYTTLNQRPHQKGENCVYENTKLSEWN